MLENLHVAMRWDLCIFGFLQMHVFSIIFVLQSVIDGDLCEFFNSLDSSKRRNIAEELDRTPAEVFSKQYLPKTLSEKETGVMLNSWPLKETQNLSTEHSYC